MKFARVFLFVLPLAACAGIAGPMGLRDPFAVNRPFEGTLRNISALDSVTTSRPVALGPVAGLAPGDSGKLNAALLAASDAHDVLAVAPRAAHRFALAGYVLRDKNAAAIHWDFLGENGAQLAAFDIPLGIKLEAGQPLPALPPEKFAELANATLTQIEAALRPPSSPFDETAPERMTIAVLRVSGAPGDGNVQLVRALRQALMGRGVPLAMKRGPGTLTIVGKVTVIRKEEADLVTLEWTVSDPAGKELGSLVQSNFVPRASLNAHWGETAILAAEAAADGVRELVAKATEAAASR